MSKDTLSNLLKKRQKVYTKIQKLQAEERQLRDKIESILASKGENIRKEIIDDKQFTLSIKENYFIPKAAVETIKTKLGKNEFEELFNVSYKLKPSTYKAPTTKNRVKKVIEPFLTIKPSPLSITVKNVEK